MLLREYESVEHYRKDVVPFLEEREAVNNLPLGIVGSLGDQFEDGSRPFLATVRDASGQLVLVALRTPPYNLVLAGHGDRLREAVELTASQLAARSAQLPGVIGLSGISEAFARTWAEATGDPVSLSMRQRIYRLDSVKPIEWTPGRLRCAVPTDIELVAEWIAAFRSEALGKDLTTVGARRAAESLIRQGRLYLWQDGRPISMAASARQTRNGIVVNEVYTPPEFRRQGYVTSCVAALSQLLLDRGHRFCSLYTDLSNPTSNSVYRKVGYYPVADSIVYEFGHGET